MKTRIILLAMAGILLGCAREYQLIRTGIEFKIPANMSNFTTFQLIWLDATSPFICRVHYKNSITMERFTLIIRCNTQHILALLDYHKNEAEADFYIYETPQSMPELVPFERFIAFLAKYDPILKKGLEEDKRVKRF